MYRGTVIEVKMDNEQVEVHWEFGSRSPPIHSPSGHKNLRWEHVYADELIGESVGLEKTFQLTKQNVESNYLKVNKYQHSSQ